MKFRVKGRAFVSNFPVEIEVEARDQDDAFHKSIEKLVYPQAIESTQPVEAVGEHDQKESRAGVVYLIRCGAFYKIGKTKNPGSRYGQLKIQLPQKPEVIHEISTNNIDVVEKHWHRHFHGSRENGEWFSLTEEDVAEFVRYKRFEVE